MPLFTWNGPEVELEFYCTATKFTIDSLSRVSKGEKVATGTIWAKDYVEHGIEFSDPWEATGVPTGDGVMEWRVRRQKDGTEFWFNKEIQEASFTANSAVNAAMKRFIAEKIKEYERDGVAVVGPARNEGPRDAYSGPCVCGDLRASTPRKPFDWLSHTNFGRFPSRCFECSCGERWWCYDDVIFGWAPVKDKDAWQMLLDYNGVAVKTVALFKDGMYLLQTVVDMGYIPFG